MCLYLTYCQINLFHSCLKEIREKAFYNLALSLNLNLNIAQKIGFLVVSEYIVRLY